MRQKISILVIILFFIFTAALIACPGKLAPTTPPTDSTTVVEIAEAIASGAVTTTNANTSEARHKVIQVPKEELIAHLFKNFFTVVPQADAAASQGTCPNYQQTIPSPAPNAGCSVGTDGSGLNYMALTLGPCNFNNPYATWSGGQTLKLNANSTTVLTCGVFPTFVNTDIVQRYFYTPTSRINNFPPLAPAPSPTPITILIDTLASNQPGAPWSGFAYQVPLIGESISYQPGPPARQITVYGIHLAGDIGGYIVWDYTVSSTSPSGVITAPLVVDGSNNITGGVLYIQDNKNQIVTQTVFTGSTGYTPGCGVPTSMALGTITTSAMPGYSFATQILTNFSAVTCGQATINGQTVFLQQSF